MALPVNSIILISYRGTCMAQRILLTMPYKITQSESAQSDTADLALIADKFGDSVSGVVIAQYLACLPSNYSLNATRAQRIYTARSVYLEVPSTASGTWDDVALTANLQHPVTMTTTTAGRNQIAVRKIGPAPTNAVASGAPTAAYVTALTALANAMTISQSIADPFIKLEPVIYHKSSGQSNEIFNYRIPDRTGTMRRRTLRVGE